MPFCTARTQAPTLEPVANHRHRASPHPAPPNSLGCDCPWQRDLQDGCCHPPTWTFDTQRGLDPFWEAGEAHSGADRR